jgi:uncharacterized protein
MEHDMSNDAVLHCPKCGSFLETRLIGEVEVDQCPICHGIWLELGELPVLLGTASIPEGNGRGASVIADVIEGLCPHCGGLGNMIRIASIKRSDIVIDACPVCYGVWLDGGELSKLAEKSLSLSIRTVIRDLLSA